MIDLPEGATGLITANQMVQGKNKENYSAFIALATEGKKNSSSGLSISGNRAAFAPGVSRNSAFVADWGGDRIALRSEEHTSELQSLMRISYAVFCLKKKKKKNTKQMRSS